MEKLSRYTLLIAGVLATSLAAAEGAAVDGVNGKISVQGGRANGDDAHIADGVLTLPVGNSYGAQLDVAGGRVLDNNYSGVGAHFFWRDPSRALLGLTTTEQKVGSISANRTGMEGERYLSNTTLSMRLGYQSGDVRNGAYGTLGATWYANENLAFSVGADAAPGMTRGGLGLEWQPAQKVLPGVSIFAHIDKGNDDFRMGMVGLRYYFDSDKSLIKRHRTADPASTVGVQTSGLSVIPVIKQQPPAPAPQCIPAGMFNPCAPT